MPKKKLMFSWIAFSTVAIGIFVFLSEWIQRATGIIFPQGIRHLSIIFVFFLNWLIMGFKTKSNQYYSLYLMLMLFYLIIAYVFVKVPSLNYSLGILFTFLFAIVFFLASNTRTNFYSLLSIFNNLLIFFIIMSVGPIFNGLLEGTTLRKMPGLFRELGAFGSSMNIGVIISLSLYIITHEKKYLYAAFFLSFGVFLTILKKSILSNIIIWIGFGTFQISARMRLKLFTYSILFILLSVILVGDDFSKDVKVNIDYYQRNGPEKHVRIGMYIAGNKIASDYFPFGSGLGTFGSLASIVNGYSPLHIKYGVDKIGSNSPKDVAAGHHTLLDTYWPHILAELGYFGTILFLLLWFFPLFATRKVLKRNMDPQLRGIIFYVVLIIIVMTNEGFTLYTPEIPSFVFLHSGITGLCYYHIKNSLV